MAAPRELLQRLHIPPSLQLQQPVTFDNSAMFSPALPTSLQQGFHPPFPLTNPSIQTPMQQFFSMPHPPGAPSRPHHQSHHSMAQLAAVGILPPGGFGPMTPLSGHFPRPSLMGGGGPPFLNRSRRQPSIGGPPKAVLGGPGRKHSPLPPAAAAAPAPTPVTKPKKIVVNLPQETVPGEEGSPLARPFWARSPLPESFPHTKAQLEQPEVSTAAVYPDDVWRQHLPETLDVFLPGKTAWEMMKQELIEERLEKLGVERATFPPVPQIHAPHARAASISSPADPALLYFKLNKLQQSQSQATSAAQSLSTSPQPLFNISPSSTSLGPLYATNRHGHSLSLAQAPMFNQFQNLSNSASPNFLEVINPAADSSGFSASPKPVFGLNNVFAPQGRLPLSMPPLPPVRPDSRPDFIRGFGLDIPEEEEPEEEADENLPPTVDAKEIAYEDDQTFEPMSEAGPPGEDTASILSRIHSRHVSRLSAALSQAAIENVSTMPLTEERSPSEEDDAVEEWTGSEDLYEESSDNESIGEWSNPSDEERARQQRVERRLRRRTASLSDNAPRRLPNFPHPPNNAISIALEREDDIISNPSEEERMQLQQTVPQYLYIQQDNYHVTSSALSSGKTPRPLPPLPSLPHSRVSSYQFTSHSRSTSSHKPISEFQPQLNPHAKPFVFGRRISETGNTSFTPPAPISASHSRIPSLGTSALSASAPEFKPSFGGMFTFRPPLGVPQMPSLPPALLHPVTEAAVEDAPRAQQGREKRQRKGSSESFVDEGDSVLSFRFPLKLDSPAPIRLQDPVSPHIQPPKLTLNPDAVPFNFTRPSVPILFSPTESVIEATQPVDEEPTLNNESPAKVNKPLKRKPLADLIISPTKARSASMHMDFRHPVSQNTVPAGLFKALINGEERTRRTVRSRLSSREIFENFRRPSLDDIDVPPISRKRSRQRLVTDPGMRESSPIEDVFGTLQHTRRRSSLPNALHSPSNSLSSNMSIGVAVDLTGRFELHHYEEKLEDMLDKKMAEIRKDLSKTVHGPSLNPSTDAAISEVISLFRTQLQESASHGLDSSHIDAHGELDLELFKDIVQQGHADAQAIIQHSLNSFFDRIASTTFVHSDVTHQIENMHAKMVDAVTRSLSQLSHRFDSMERERNVHESVVESVISALTPMLAELRADPVDYDFLTARLAQAVKPHISQLIDLSSDKQETAGLIVDRILPLLPTANPPSPPLDTDALVLQLVTEVRKAIAPIDAFEIKEQVADLVVERLDSRLMVRDKTLNMESVATKVLEGVQTTLNPLFDLSSSIKSVAEEQSLLVARHSHLEAMHKESSEALRQLPAQLDSITRAVTQLSSASTSSNDSKVLSEMNSVKFITEKLVEELQRNSTSFSDLRSLQRSLLDQVESLPNFTATTNEALQHIQTEMALTVRTAQREAEELRRANADHQVQLAKARSAHGQMRVEKDRLQEKLTDMNAEQERLLARVKELESSSQAKALEIAALEAKASKQDDGLTQALSRLQASDIEKQASRNHITDLEESKRDLTTENQTLKSKIIALELQATFAARDKEASANAMATLQKQYDNLVSQQGHWDELRATSAHIERLTALLGEADNQELTELRSIRDKSQVLEGEHMALKRRCKELESAAASSDKAATAARQNLTQNQQRVKQRSSEWEKKEKEYEAKVEILQTQLEQSEQMHAQLDADHSAVNMQLEEKEAEERMMKDREEKLKEQINSLETKAKRLQTELLQAKAQAASTARLNGLNGRDSRPDSRASTVLVDYPNDRASTPNGFRMHSSSGSATPPNQPSVWDSIHAPSSNYRPPTSTAPTTKRYPNLGPTTPKANRSYIRTSYRRVPSPTPSTVSQAPTLGEDGWYH